MAGPSEDFTRLCVKILEAHFGKLSFTIVSKAASNKVLDSSSTYDDYKEFIDLIESNISALAGKHKAAEIGGTLRAKAVEFTERHKIPGAKVSAPAAAPAAKTEAVAVHEALSPDISTEISNFLQKNTLPTEEDIADYAKYISLKYGGDSKQVENDIIDRIKSQIKKTIGSNRLSKELGKFLSQYPQPAQTDIDDFIRYIGFLKLSFSETELRELIEKERLYRKFHGSREETAAPAELNQFISIIQSTPDKEGIKDTMTKQHLGYLLKDESGNFDDSLSEIVNLIAPAENDMKEMLNGYGLKHLIKKDTK